MDLTPELRELAKLIWTSSRSDEGTISAIGAEVVAKAIAGSDWLAKCQAGAWAEGYAEGAIAARGLDALDNPYRD